VSDNPIGAYWISAYNRKYKMFRDVGVSPFTSRICLGTAFRPNSSLIWLHIRDIFKRRTISHPNLFFWQQIEIASFDDGQSAFFNPQFVVDIFNVVEDSVKADKKLFGDLFVF
jgi:hypothetical protein